MALFRGNNLNNILKGLSSDDMLAGLGGNDTLDGGAGIDTAWYSGNVSGYDFSAVAGHLVVRDVIAADGSDGTDNLLNIEKLQFGDVQFGVASQFQVSAPVDLVGNNPAIAHLADGGFVVSWESLDGSSIGIFAQHYDSNGVAMGPETRVNTTTFDTQEAPVVAALADGGFVISWDSQGQDGSSRGVYGQRFDPSGGAVGTEFQVNTTTAGPQDRAAIADLADGGTLVAWDSGSGVFSQRYDSAGAAVGSETQVVATGGFPAIAGLNSGGYVVTWQADDGGGFGNGVFAQRYDAAGVAAGGSFLVNTTTNDNQDQPAIAALAHGGFVIAWESFQSGTTDDIFIRRYDESGVAAGSEMQVNANSTAEHVNPSIASLSDGGFVVTWMASVAGGDWDVFAQRFDAAGAAAGAAFLVNAASTNDQTFPTVAGLSDGGFVIDWMNYDSGTGHSGIYAQRFDALGAPEGLTLTGSSSGEVINLDPSQHLTVDGASGNDTINGSSGDDIILGGAGNDVIKGNAGNDQLDGGAGNDSLTGGTGDDNYVVDSTGDVLTEKPGEGSDSVLSSVSWTLAANFENLTLTGSGNTNATGNAQGNLIEGNGGNNVLNGGAGADILSGGGGNDTYVVDNVFDFVNELPGGGTDLVQSSVSFALPDNVENLTLTGTGAVNGTGNASANALLGNSANNVLDGQGGADAINGLAGNDSLAGGAGADILTGGLGNDTLSGGTEADTFIFDAALGSANVDVVLDFSGGYDKLNLSESVFGALGTTGITLPTAQFHSGAGVTAAASPTDHILYNTTTGDLYYDSDGSGAAAAIKFAVLTGAPSINENDFFVTT